MCEPNRNLLTLKSMNKKIKNTNTIAMIFNGKIFDSLFILFALPYNVYGAQ